MNKIVKLPQKDGFGRDLYYLFISKFSDFPEILNLSSKYFVLLFAGDVDSIEDEKLLSWSHNLMNNGVVYFCAYGKNCQEAENAVDFAGVERKIDKKGLYNEFNQFVMTNSSEKDSLDEFLWFGLYCAYPDDEYAEECESNLIVVVENENWNKHIISKLSDIKSFNQEMIERE